MDLFLTGNDFFSRTLGTSQLNSTKSFNLSVLQKLENGMFLINMRGNNYKIALPKEAVVGDYRATVEKKADGGQNLKLQLLKTPNNQPVRQEVSIPKEIKPGVQIEVKVLKLIKNGLFQIDFKGKLLQAEMKNVPTSSSFRAEVLKTEPQLELKPIPLPMDQLKAQDIKGELIRFDKPAIIDSLKSSGRFHIDQISSAAIEKVVKESGNFLENKLLNDFKVIDDNKFNAIKTGDMDLKDAIQKVQLFNSMLNNAAFSFFSMNDQNIKDGEIFISRDKDSFSVHLKVDFTKIGETLIKIVVQGDGVDVVVSSDKDISKELAALDIPSMRIHWKKINEQEKEKFNLESIIMQKLGNFEVIA